jgi:hypothetical protein
MSQLREFYRGNAVDREGRWLRDIRRWSDDELEFVHDFIQWMFPLPEPSRFNPDAPLLTDEDVALFRADPVLQDELRQSFTRILTFLGLRRRDDGTVVEGDNFSKRAVDVWNHPNHNWLRITRILRSLTLLGLQAEARALHQRLSALHESRRFPISDDTFGYWTGAVG